MTELTTTAPAFVEMAHRIVWATVATVGADGAPRSRVLHPIWEWDGTDLTGWIATSPGSPKAADLEYESQMSITYWSPTQDTCTADCDTEWVTDRDGRHAGWNRFLEGPEPVGYDPSIIPPWTDPDAEAFGILRLVPHRLRVMPGTMMTAGTGSIHTWSR